MKNLLYANLIAQAASLYNYSSNIESAADMSDKVFGAITGVFSIFMIVGSVIPFLMFGFVFFIIFKTIRTQSKMRNNVDNMVDHVQSQMNNMNATTKTEPRPTPEPKSKPSYQSPINTDPNAVIDMDNVLDSNNTDPIKKS